MSGNWYCFLKYKTPKQLKKQETEIKTNPTVLPKRAMKRSKRWRKELSKIKRSCHSQKVLWDQMAKVVIYLFTYFCNIECYKIIYGIWDKYRQQTHTILLLLPFLLQLGCRENGHMYIIQPFCLQKLCILEGCWTSNLKQLQRLPGLLLSLQWRRQTVYIYRVGWYTSSNSRIGLCLYSDQPGKISI